jgi:hypothetical protein
MKKWIFRISILFNFIFLIGWFSARFNSPSHALGRLEKDIEIGYFGGNKTLFKLPKGLYVRNASQRGISAIGQFENERFEIVITSDNSDLINYDLPKDSLRVFNNFYSVDIRAN